MDLTDILNNPQPFDNSILGGGVHYFGVKGWQYGIHNDYGAIFLLNEEGLQILRSHAKKIPQIDIAPVLYNLDKGTKINETTFGEQNSTPYSCALHFLGLSPTEYNQIVRKLSELKVIPQSAKSP